VSSEALIVSYESREHTLRLLRDLAALRGRLAVSVFDNGSRDGTLDAVAAAFPWVRRLQSEENLGYAGALRAALPSLSAERLWLLNADLRLPDPSAYLRLEGALERDPSVGAVGPALLDPDGARGAGGGGAALSLRSAALHFSGLSRLPGWRRTGLYLPQDQLAGAAALQVEWLAGTAPLLRREALERAGGVPDSPFLYGEDLVLSLALRRAGYRLLYVPRAHVVHVGQGSQDGPSGRWVEGTLAVAEPGQRRPLAWCFALGLGARLAWGRAARALGRGAPKGRLEALRAGAEVALRAGLRGPS
jgi:GT2 family glycosyltransferase